MNHFQRGRSLPPIRQPMRNERGAILVIALLALVVLSVLGLTFISISKTESDISYNDRDSGRALYVADSGLERFKRDLRYDCTYPGTNTSDRYLASPAPVGDGTLSDGTNTYVKSSAPVTRYYDLGAALTTTFANLTAYQQQTLNGGGYALKLKTDSDGIIVQSTGSIGSRVARTIEAKFEAKSLSVWDNAIFGGVGASGAMINGNVTIAGSVHILGTGLTSTDIAMDLGGGATILNQYTGISVHPERKIGPEFGGHRGPARQAEGRISGEEGIKRRSTVAAPGWGNRPTT